MAETVLKRDSEGNPQQTFAVNDNISNAAGTVSATAAAETLFLVAGDAGVTVNADNSMVLSAGGTNVTLAADGSVEVDAVGAVEVTAGGALSLLADGNIAIGPSTTFDPTGNVDLAGIVTIGTDGAVDIGPGRVEVAADGAVDLGNGSILVAAGGTLVTVASDFVASAASVKMPALPTADPVAAGQLWNNLGVVMVSAG